MTAPLTSPLPKTPGNFPHATEDQLGGPIGPGKRKSPKEELIQLLDIYFDEGQEARESGLDSRDRAWADNHDAYFGRIATRGKAEWQAQEQMPEVANFVDRFVASFRLALMSDPNFFNLHDPRDRNRLLDQLMVMFLRVQLDHCGRNVSGHRVGFDGVFGDILKAGALMANALSVTERHGKLLIEAVDARELYYDPTGRGLYRIRRYQMDFWQLDAMKKERHPDGKLVWDVKAIDALQAEEDREQLDEKARSQGTAAIQGPTWRKPIKIDEYLCTIIDQDGKLVAENQLVVRANERFIIRGPENNPFWHGQDWIVMAPSISVPFSVWGRSYVDLFRQLANTFNEVTNLMLDGTFSGAVAAHMVHLDALHDPSQLSDGIHPGMTVLAHDDWPAGKDFIKKIEMGGLNVEAFRIWEALKAELREGAGANELSLGQVPPKGDITATEINASTRGSSVLTSSLAKDIEVKLLQPMLELAFMTSLQIFDPENDPEIAELLGEPMTQMLVSQREQLRERKFVFKATGISSAIERGQRAQGLLAFLQILGQSEILAREFVQEHSLMSVIRELMVGFQIDPATLRKTPQEREADDQRTAQAMALQRATGALGQGGEGGGPGSPGRQGGSPNLGAIAAS